MTQVNLVADRLKSFDPSRVDEAFSKTFIKVEMNDLIEDG